MKIRKEAILLSSLLLSLTQAWGQANDRLLPILRQELGIQMEELKKQKEAPYYMSFRTEDERKVTLSSDFGVEAQSKDTHLRYVVPQIRLGSMELDNFKYTTQGEVPQSTPTYMPLHDDGEDAVRVVVWGETLKRYDFATSVMDQTRIQATTGVANEDKAACFSKAPVERYYEEPITEQQLKLKKEEWQKRLNEVSAVFRSYPELLSGNATLEFQVRRTYFLNTEGSEVVQNHVYARVLLMAQLMADDGMELPLNKDYFAYSLDSLPDTKVMMADAKDMIERLKALKNAPVADPYTGPAILSGAASGVFFHEIFGHRLEGHRLKKGGETFKKMVGQRVLPESFQVYSDPLLTHYGGTALNGHYLYDEEGVKARRVNNVENGVLKEFLLSRVPLDGFPQSNGHGRAVGTKDAVSRQSNLVVETTKPYTEAELRKMLIAEAKKQGKEYGYYYKTVTSGFTFTGEGGSLNSFNVTPLEVYRVFVDGRPDQLVRGVELIGTPLAMFSKIEAGGDKPSVFTGSCGAESGWVPVTASSPMIFASQIETQRRQPSQSLPPILPAPEFRDATANAGSEDDVILHAMKDEMASNQEKLVLAGSARPFYMSYITTRYRLIQVISKLGAVSSSVSTPWRMVGNAQVLVGNFKRDSEVQQGQYLQTYLPAVADYSGIRRGFWGISDMGYKYALGNFSQKMNYLQSKPLSKELETLPDMQRMMPVTKIDARKKQFVADEAALQHIANELSVIFKDYKELFNTSVTISGGECDIYRTTTENVVLKQPVENISIKVNTYLRMPDGYEIQDTYVVSADTPSELPSLEEMKRQVRAFADSMMACLDMKTVEESYAGPVMYEDEAVATIFAENLTKPGQLVAQKTLDGSGKSFANKLERKIIDTRLTVKNYTSVPEYKGVSLSGYYETDADGITPEREMTLVEKGVLKKMLNGRNPVPGAVSSTGSTRFPDDPMGAIPTVSIGTLHIQAEKTTNVRDMKKELLKTAKKEKLKYAYIVRLPKGYGSLQLYRVDVKTGEETRVCTNSMSLPPLSKLEELVAVSSQENVQNVTDGVHTSIIYPSAIILDDMEIGKANMSSTKEPALKYPLQR